MESDPEPFVKNPKRSFRNWFIGLFLLGLLSVPILYFSEVRHDPDWNPITFVALGVGIAVVYALFLSFLSVGFSFLMDRRRPGRMKLFFAIFFGVPLLLNVSLLLFIKLSTPDSLVERIEILAPIYLWIAAVMLLALIGIACFGWWKYLSKAVPKSAK